MGIASEQDVVARVEGAFTQVQQRMDGLPFLNPRLQVRAVGFQPWQQYWLGVVVTPWFMNLMLVPREELAEVPAFGEARVFEFPCGTFSFIAGYEGDMGGYLSCSLFSPVQELDSQQLAEQIALASLKQLLGKVGEEKRGDEKQDAEKVAEEGAVTPSTVQSPGIQDPPRRALFRRMLGQPLNKAEVKPGLPAITEPELK